MGAIALRLAAEGAPACPLAASDAPTCHARPEDATLEDWATLEDALHGHWTCLFRCERRHAALKTAAACPGPIALSVPSLIVALGARFPLARLVHKARCPSCGSEAFSIEWRVPEAVSPPPPEPDFDADFRAAVDAELRRRRAPSTNSRDSAASTSARALRR